MRQNLIKKCKTVYALILSSTVVHASVTIVDYTFQNGFQLIRDANVEALDGHTWNFSDEAMGYLFEGVNAGENSNTQIHGGLKANWAVRTEAFTPNFHQRSSGSLLNLQVNAETSQQGLVGMLVWNKSNFLNHEQQTVVFDGDSSLKLETEITSGMTEVRFVVNNGGFYYVSEPVDSETMELLDPRAKPWATIDTADYGIVETSYALRNFSDIQGVGIFISQTAINQTMFQLTDLQVSATTPTITMTNPGITTTTLPGAAVTIPYSQQLQVNGGDAPIMWSLGSGSLPSGLSLSSGGLISGTPTAEETCTFTVSVRDFNGDVDEQVLTLNVGAVPTTQTASFNAIEDAYLENENRFNNTTLRIEPNNRISYLKFEVEGVTETIENVTLSMRVTDDAGSGTINFYAGTHNSWAETDITVASAPTKGVLLGSINGIFNQNSVYSIDLTGLLMSESNGIYTVIAEMVAGGDDVSFGSSEGSYPPVLEVTYDTTPLPSRTIVDFTHQDGTQGIRNADIKLPDAYIWNFSDDVPLFTGIEAGGNSSTRVFGGLKATWVDEIDESIGFPPIFQMRGSTDLLQLQVNPGTSRQELKGILLWKKSDFLDHSSQVVVFDPMSSISADRAYVSGSTHVRFVVNDGGSYYVSQFEGDGSGMQLDNPAGQLWATIELDDYPVTGPFESQEFTDIQGVGIYIEQWAPHQIIFQLTDFQVSATTEYHPPVDVELANIFGSGCVLQRDQTVPIWGTATPGDAITVEINGQLKQSIADVQGNWRIELEPTPAGGPYTLFVDGDNSFLAELTQVYFGDVWIMTGQSNMFEQLAGHVNRFSDDYPPAPNADDDFDDMRIALVQDIAADVPADDVTMIGSWSRWQRSNLLNQMSTVGYFFGRYLNDHLDANGMADVPLGFIKVCWNGTAIEQWISEGKLDAVEAANPGIIRHRESSVYYNGMIAPIQDFPIKGAIWYQGEANASSIKRITQYPILKEALLDSWREQWRNPDMPFYFVQLAPFRAYEPLPGDERWAWMREIQESCLQFSNTGMASIIEGGHQGEIHPPFKDRVGERLARIALDKTYGIPTVHRGPTLQSPVQISGSEVTVTFDNVASGLETRAVDAQPDADEIAEGFRGVSVSASELAGFYLCGADEKFYPALEATIIASNQVRISNAVDVPSPVAVRYAFQDFPRCNLFNSEGLPAEPFRTDTFAFKETSAPTDEYTIWKYDTLTPAQLGEAMSASDTDADNDGMSLLEEYALGGNPLVSDGPGTLPTHELSTSNPLTTYLYFTHNERTDDPSLTYTVERRGDLLSGDWDTVGVELVEETAVSGVWKTVTNRTKVDDKEFMRLRVEEN